MEYTSRDAARVRFRGTRFAYDRGEVDRFHRDVIAALAGYEAALEEAETELARLRRAGRGLTRSARSGDDPRGESSKGAPQTIVVTDDPLASFHRWRREFAAERKAADVVGAAREHAAMIRGTAAARAADEIERLTASARSEARAITKRAAMLAADTEEAARQRAGEILDSRSETKGWDRAMGDAEMQVLSDRIVRLRSSIADVQGRLDSLATGDDASADDAELIEIDLRADSEGKAPARSKRSRKRQKVAAMAEAEITTEALEAKMADLKRRLTSD